MKMPSLVQILMPALLLVLPTSALAQCAVNPRAHARVEQVQNGVTSVPVFGLGYINSRCGYNAVEFILSDTDGVTHTVSPPMRPLGHSLAYGHFRDVSPSPYLLDRAGQVVVIFTGPSALPATLVLPCSVVSDSVVCR
jgi:hypothetical protein